MPLSQCSATIIHHAGVAHLCCLNFLKFAPICQKVTLHFFVCLIQNLTPWLRHRLNERSKLRPIWDWHLILHEVHQLCIFRCPLNSLILSGNIATLSGFISKMPMCLVFVLTHALPGAELSSCTEQCWILAKLQEDSKLMESIHYINIMYTYECVYIYTYIIIYQIAVVCVSWCRSWANIWIALMKDKKMNLDLEWRKEWFDVHKVVSLDVTRQITALPHLTLVRTPSIWRKSEDGTNIFVALTFFLTQESEASDTEIQLPTA